MKNKFRSFTPQTRIRNGKDFPLKYLPERKRVLGQQSRDMPEHCRVRKAMGCGADRNPGLRGSLTLEAAVVFPLYIFFMLALLSLMQMLQFHGDVNYSLASTAKEIAVYMPAKSLLESGNGGKEGAAGNAGTAGNAESAGNAGTAEDANEVEGMAETVLGEAYTFSQLTKELPAAYRKQMHVKEDISLLQSSIMKKDDMVDLVATYGFEPFGNVFGIPVQRTVSRARTRAWTGFSKGGGMGDEGEESERIVYIAENGEVYHLSRSCTHLDLSIHAVDVNAKDSQRNVYGEKYTVCEICGAPSFSDTTVYITNEGDRYHSSLTCSGLKRTIYEVPISRVGDKRMCSRCAKTFQ